MYIYTCSHVHTGTMHGGSAIALATGHHTNHIITYNVVDDFSTNAAACGMYITFSHVCHHSSICDTYESCLSHTCFSLSRIRHDFSTNAAACGMYVRGRELAWNCVCGAMDGCGCVCVMGVNVRVCGTCVYGPHHYIQRFGCLLVLASKKKNCNKKFGGCECLIF